MDADAHGALTRPCYFYRDTSDRDTSDRATDRHENGGDRGPTRSKRPRRNTTLLTLLSVTNGIMGRRKKIVQECERLMDEPDNIRNIAIAAHVDHGKTTLSDNLLAGAGMISQDTAGEQLAMDTKEARAGARHHHRRGERFDDPRVRGHQPTSSTSSTRRATSTSAAMSPVRCARSTAP